MNTYLDGFFLWRLFLFKFLGHVVFVIGYGVIDDTNGHTIVHPRRIYNQSQRVLRHLKFGSHN